MKYRISINQSSREHKKNIKKRIVPLPGILMKYGDCYWGEEGVM